MPSPLEPKIATISVVIGDGLYVLDTVPDSTYHNPFEALIYSGDTRSEDKWYWHSLPPPPFGFDYEHEEEGVEEDDDESCGQNRYVIQASTVVGDSQIWISTEGGGTYSFNTKDSVWSKAGKWALPFYGPVKYAPEHGLWFGFSSSQDKEENANGQFAASDLAAASTTRPPVLQEAWDELARPLPDRWVPMQSYLEPLGAGKFCIVRTFETAEEGWCWENGGDHGNTETFAVFTGVEVERGRRGALRMIKHKSIRYSFVVR